MWNMSEVKVKREQRRCKYCRSTKLEKSKEIRLKHSIIGLYYCKNCGRLNKFKERYIGEEE